MSPVPDRSLEPFRILMSLVDALQSRGLDAEPHQMDGEWYVHVSPLQAPTAGTDVRMVVTAGRAQFFSEWGAGLGTQLEAVTAKIARWFGRTRP